MMPAPRVTAAAAVSAYGRGLAALRDGVLGGVPAFADVDRFDVSGRRDRAAATLPGAADLGTELAGVIDAACAEAGLGPDERAGTPLLLAVHADPVRSRSEAAPEAVPAGVFAADLATRCGLGTSRAYTGACVAGTSALADAAASIRAGRAERVVVAAGYLVEPDQFALFDAGRALAPDHTVRPFSAGRKGMVLGDAVSAVVVESPDVARGGTPALGTLAGWGRAGDAYHVCQPRPDGTGLAAAIGAALRRGGVTPDEVAYVNAHGTGTTQSDAAEAAAFALAFGAATPSVPVSSTKSLHGHALEASGLLEVIITMLALRDGRLPVNAGFLGPDERCPLRLVLDDGTVPAGRYALTVNSAFGGANTAILVGAA